MFGVDDGISATTIWSYNIKAAGGQVATSPALSLDGTKVAFVETGKPGHDGSFSRPGLEEWGWSCRKSTDRHLA